MTFVRRRGRRRDRGRRPRQFGAQLTDARARIPRPTQSRRRQRDEPDDDPRADGPVPGQCSTPLRRIAIGYEDAVQLVGPSSITDPEHQPAQRRHPQPARGDLAVIATDDTQMQVAVQVVEPCTYRQPFAHRGQRSAHLAGVGIDEDGARSVRRQVVDTQRDPRGRVRLRRRRHRRDGSLRMSSTRRSDLIAQR